MGLRGWLIVVIIVLISVIAAEWKQVEHANRKWEVAEANVKAYSNQLSKLGEKNVALQLTANQLSFLNDSVLQELDATRKQLKIKNKNLKAVSAVHSSFSKTDTITIKDTIFKSPHLAIDTIVGDEWYNVELGLKYPSTVIVKPEFKSKKHIIVSAKRETVNPPKKFFLFRWFQKKHTVLHVDVVEKNPYVKDENSRYVEIIN